MSMSEMYQKLKNNTINNDELITCLKSENYRIVAISISRLIERNISNQDAVSRLEKLSNLLSNSKFVGPWQMGHFAIAALLLLKNNNVENRAKELYDKLSEKDKFLVDNFIKAEAYKL